jgi:pimeloyl-ACP methyl ester carboxylesterase
LGQYIASDGARIAYDEEGEGRPLLLLHGLMANRHFFAPQLALAGRFRLIRIDLRGHGESRAAAPPPDVATLAADVAGLAESLALEDAVAIGWSLGAAVLWHLLAGPSAWRFAGAVIVDMTPRVMNDSGWRLGLSPETCAARARSIAEDFEGFAGAAGAAIFAQAPEGPSPSLAGWAAGEFAKADPASVGSLWQSLVGEDFRPLLAAIRQPTLVVHGAHSHLYGADTAEHLVAALPNARAASFAGSGHAPHLEQPERFNRLVSDFADSLTAPIETIAGERR